MMRNTWYRRSWPGWLILVIGIVGVADPFPVAAKFPLEKGLSGSRPQPASLSLEGEGPWVVRAYFSDPQQVRDLAAWLEPWEVVPDQQYLVVGVTRAEYERLLLAGFHLEVDPILTAELHRPRLALPDQKSGIPGFPCYRTVEETMAAAQAMALAHPQLATWADIGDSWEKSQPGGDPGYDLRVLRLTNEEISGPKPKLFVMAAIHAREYATAELILRFAEHLVHHYSLDPDVTWILNHHEIHLLFQANPDGRKKAEAGALWRKNTDSDDGCSDPNRWGTDLNRNFGFQWGCCGGSSSAPCDEVYRGQGAASEPETQGVQDYVRSQFPDQRDDDLAVAAPDDATGVFVDIHSYGDLVLWPWGFTSLPAPNAVALQTLGRKLAYWNGYLPKQAVSLYLTDGTTQDWAYGELGLAAYIIEVGNWFFQDCDTFEGTILPDNLTSLLYAAKVARTPYQTPAGPDIVDIKISPAAVEPGQSEVLVAEVDDTRYSSRNGAEPAQTILAAEYYLDTPPWKTDPLPNPQAMTAVDGGFDEAVEQVQAVVDTSSLSYGRHILFIRGQDAANHWGAFSAVFLSVVNPQQTTYLPLAVKGE